MDEEVVKAYFNVKQNLQLPSRAFVSSKQGINACAEGMAL